MAETPDRPSESGLEQWQWDLIEKIARKEIQHYQAKEEGFQRPPDRGLLQKNWYPSTHSTHYSSPSIQAGVQAGPKGLTPDERYCFDYGHKWGQITMDSPHVLAVHRCRRCGVVRQQNFNTTILDLEAINALRKSLAAEPDAIPEGIDLCIWCGHEFPVEEIEAHEDVCSS